MGRKSVERSRKPRSEKTKKWAEALLPLIQQVSLSDLTIDQLAELLGKSKSTLYEYFNSKEEIILYIIEVRLEKIKAYKSSLPKWFVTGSYQETISLLAQQTEDIEAEFLSDLKVNFPVAWEQVEIFINDLLNDFKEFYKAGIEKGIFRKVSVDLLIAMDKHFLTELMLNSQFIKQSGINLGEVIRDYLEIRMLGINQTQAQNEII